jgi:hypothetical protein
MPFLGESNMKRSIAGAFVGAFAVGLLFIVIGWLLPSGTFVDQRAAKSIVIGVAIIGSIMGGVSAILEAIRQQQK